MTALCDFCPLHWFCETEEDKRLLRRNWELSQENARLREQAIENGLSCGAGKNYTGETK